jgi:ribosome-binding factor A
MPTHRVDKVASQLQVEISDILARRLRDPRVGLISVLGVEVTPDLRVARVRVSTLGGAEDHEELMKVLDHARGFIRHELAEGLRTLRRVPEIRFVDDRNTEYAVEIERVLREIHQQEAPGER